MNLVSRFLTSTALIGLCFAAPAQASTPGINTDGGDLPLGAGGATYMTIRNDTGNVGIKTTTPATTLEVNGGVKIGGVSLACTSALAGTIRLNGTSFQGCNGSAWKNLGGSNGYAITILGTSCPSGFSIYATYSTFLKITGFGGDCCTGGCGNNAGCCYPTGSQYTTWSVCYTGEVTNYLAICFYDGWIVPSCTPSCASGFTPGVSFAEYYGQEGGGYCSPSVYKKSLLCSKS